MNTERKPIRFLVPAGIAFLIAYGVGFVVSHPTIGGQATRDVAKVVLGLGYGIVAAVGTMAVQGVRWFVRRSGAKLPPPPGKWIADQALKPKYPNVTVRLTGVNDLVAAIADVHAALRGAGVPQDECYRFILDVFGSGRNPDVMATFRKWVTVT